MSNKLPKSTKDRIYADASKWSEMQYGHDDVNKDYLEGALHEAGLAQAAEASAKERGKIITTLNNRLTNVETALKEAEQRSERYKKALSQLKLHIISCHNHLINPDGLNMLRTIDEALTPNPTTDDTVNG